MARSRANPCLWRHDSNGRHRDASGEGVFSKIHGCGTNVVEALPWHGYSFPGPGPVGRPPQHPAEDMVGIEMHAPAHCVFSLLLELKESSKAREPTVCVGH